MFPLDRQAAGVGPRASAILAVVEVGHGMVCDDLLGDVGGRAPTGRAHEQFAIGQFDGVRSDESATPLAVPDEDARLFHKGSLPMNAADRVPHAQHGFAARAFEFGGIVGFPLASPS